GDGSRFSRTLFDQSRARTTQWERLARRERPWPQPERILPAPPETWDQSGLTGGKESGVRSQESGARSQESGVRSQKPGVRSQESGVRSQESGVRSQESGVRSQEPGVRESGVRESGVAEWDRRLPVL